MMHVLEGCFHMNLLKEEIFSFRAHLEYQILSCMYDHDFVSVASLAANHDQI